MENLKKDLLKKLDSLKFDLDEIRDQINETLESLEETGLTEEELIENEIFIDQESGSFFIEMDVPMVYMGPKTFWKE